MSSYGNMFSASKVGMDHQYKLNKQLADQDRAWQERMSNSAHQREISDLKKAGLNPVLSVTGGNGASTPSGSSTSVSDGAGYFSALANLEAAQLSSAATIKAATLNKEAAEYTADKNYETQTEIHNTPGLNNIYGVLSRFPEIVLSGAGSIGVFANALDKFWIDNDMPTTDQLMQERKNRKIKNSDFKGDPKHDIDVIVENLLNDSNSSRKRSKRKRKK